MGVVNQERIAALANSCSLLLKSGLDANQIRHAIEESPRALDAMVRGDYTTALALSQEISSRPRRDAIDPATGEWIQLPDNTRIVDAEGHTIGTVSKGISPDVKLTASLEEQVRALQQSNAVRGESSALMRRIGWAVVGTLIAGSLILSDIETAPASIHSLRPVGWGGVLLLGVVWLIPLLKRWR